MTRSTAATKSPKRPTTRPRSEGATLAGLHGALAGTVEISRRYDATRRAYEQGVLTKGDWEKRKAGLDAELKAAVTAERSLMAELGPLGVSIGTTVVVSGEPIESVWGNQVRADLLALNSGKLETAGGTVTGALHATGNIRMRNATNDAFIDWYNLAQTTRYGYIKGTPTVLQVASDNALAFFTDNTERARFVGSTGLLFGKTASDLNDPGVEVYGTGASALGSIRTTITAASIQNVYCRHMGSADADLEGFAHFARSSAGTLIGAIAQATTTGVTFVTTSSKKLKNDRGAITGALDKLARIAPRLATFKGADAKARPEMVWYAEDVAREIPEAVVPECKVSAALAKRRGYGKAGDVEPAMMDYGRTTPLIAAAVLELADRLVKLEHGGK